MRSSLTSTALSPSSTRKSGRSSWGGDDFFTTPFDAVYTRLVREPDWGVKVTGKAGAHTVAAYVLCDDVTSLMFPGSQGSAMATLDESSQAGVGRYRLDLGSRHTLGLLTTSQRADGLRNGGAGVNMDLRFSDLDQVTAQLLASSTTYPGSLAETFDQPRGRLDDLATRLAYTHETRACGTWLTYADVGRDFRADSGFMPRVDYRHTEAGGQCLWTGTPDDWYSRLLLIAKVSLMEDQDGTLLESEVAVRYNVEGPLQSHVYTRPSYTRQGYAGKEFGLAEAEFHLCLRPNAHSHAYVTATAGDSLDYATSRDGDRILLQPGFWYRFGRHSRVEASFAGERMEVGTGWLYRAQVAQVTAAWQFDPQAFV